MSVRKMSLSNHVESKLEFKLSNSPFLASLSPSGSKSSRSQKRRRERRRTRDRIERDVSMSESNTSHRSGKSGDATHKSKSASKPRGRVRVLVTVDTSKAHSNADVLRKAIRDLGWRECPHGRRDKASDIYWNAVSFRDNLDICSGRVNKFPGSPEIFSKTNLFQCLDFMQKLYPSEYDFYPRTWHLPQQYQEFCSDVRQLTERKVKPKMMYIVKPSEGSQGEGIYLLRDPSGYTSHNNRSHVVQEYLSNVLILDKFKFDLRIYVVVTSLDPLEIYICKEGLARFSTIPYETPSIKNMHETFMHLTNYSLNKRSSTFNKSDLEDEGSKRKLTSVLERLERMGHCSTRVMEAIERVVCKTMIAIAGELKVEHQSALPPGKPGPSCFQVLGFDIILLNNLKPMLLEVNSNPSLRIDCEVEVSPGVMEYQPSAKDEDVKRPLIRDALRLVAPKGKYIRSRKRIQQRLLLEQQRAAAKAAEKEMEPSARTSETAITIKFQEIKVVDPELPAIPNRNELAPQNTLEGAFVSCVDRRLPSSEPEEEEEEDENDKEEEEEEEEEEDNDDDEASCLMRIFPDRYGTEYERLRLMEKVSDLFIYSVGCRSSQRMGPTGFRTFARHRGLNSLRMCSKDFIKFSRKCRLNRRGFTNASVDILYIDMQRKWERLNPERTSGLCYQGFLDACYEIARRKFYDSDRLEMIQSFVNYCQENMRQGSDIHLGSSESSKTSRLTNRATHNRTVHLFPRLTVTSLEEETVQSLYDRTLARQRSNRQAKADQINSYITEKKQLTYLPKQLQLHSSDE